MSDKVLCNRKTASIQKIQSVILMLDTSGSMAWDCGETKRSRIDVLNDSVKKMLEFFSSYKGATAIQVAIVTFGGTAQLFTDLVDAASVRFSGLRADGGTPLGSAISIAEKIIEKIDSKQRRPILVLVSDGEPEKGWESSFNKLLSLEQGKRCERQALGISVREGSEAHEVLQKFVSLGEKVFLGGIDEITGFFNFIMQSATGLVMSKNPKITYRSIYDK